MRVLVACEFSGIVRDAFRDLGHDAWSCDLADSERPGPHLKMDALQVAYTWPKWDLMIAHPPCTHLATSGARHFARRRPEQEAALQFVADLMNAPIPRICIENPRGIISTRIAKPTQWVQPWMFGDTEQKMTHLWLDGLLPLKPTRIVEPLFQRVYLESSGPEQAKNRSRTPPGLARAMAEQWGGKW